MASGQPAARTRLPLPTLRVLVVLVCIAATLVGASSCARRSGQDRLVVFHAGSLAGPLRDLARLFEERYPGVAVQREASGSRMAARKITQLGRRADVVAVADYLIARDLMKSQAADWYASFGRNRMVIAFTERSTRAAEINAQNWYEILLAPETRFGHSDPDLDPAGYRTLMVWQLAESHYEVFGLYEGLQAACPQGNIRPSSVELLPLLESLDLDYIFGYESVARQHHLRILHLPPEIDLGSPELEAHYRQASVQVSGERPGYRLKVTATPIAYAVTIPREAENQDLAEAFCRLLFSEEGRDILTRNFQTPIFPALAGKFSQVPRSLQEVVLTEW